MPDTFFRNERRGAMHNVLVPNLYVRIHSDGTVLFSIRVSLTLSCPMNLKLYPLDTQTCPMQIASCKLTPELVTGFFGMDWMAQSNLTMYKQLSQRRLTFNQSQLDQSIQMILKTI